MEKASIKGIWQSARSYLFAAAAGALVTVACYQCADRGQDRPGNEPPPTPIASLTPDGESKLAHLFDTPPQVETPKYSDENGSPVSAYSVDELEKHESDLTRCALRDLTLEEKELWDKHLPALLPYYDEVELQTAQDALRDFSHIIYHQTAMHNLVDNHSVLRQVEPELRKYCELHNLEYEPLAAVISWENSGSHFRVSYAGAGGVCQMMEGTVQFAHQLAHEEAEKLRSQARELKALGGDERQAQAAILVAKAAKIDCGTRHKNLAKKYNCDERFITSCNLEDAVIYFKYLMEKYEGRVDLAISAYHTGIDNIDDCIYRYIEETDGVPFPRGEDRYALRQALRERKITYADLWNNTFVRSMLGGVRTMDGEWTTEANQSQAIGDESDLYLWKVLGSWCAYNAGEDFVMGRIVRHVQERENCELWFLPEWKRDEWNSALRYGYLVDLRRFWNGGNKALSPGAGKTPKHDLAAMHLANKGVDYFRPLNDKDGKKIPFDDKELAKVSWSVRPEMAGYLWSLETRWREAMQSETIKLPVRTLLAAGISEYEAMPGDKQANVDDICPSHRYEAHQRGMAVDLDYSGLDKESRRVLDRLVDSDYIFDITYVRHHKNGAHIVFNPVHGDTYLRIFNKVCPDGCAEK